MKNKKEIKKLCVFDFDNTLINTPLRKAGMKKWEEHYGKKYPSKAWWSDPESLDTDVFKDEIFPKPDVLFDFRRFIEKNDTWVIMLTHRLPTLDKQVSKILNEFDIKFDDHLYRRSFFLTKANDLDEYIPQFPNLNEIEIWEDRESEIKILQNWAYKIDPWVDFDININIIKT